MQILENLGVGERDNLDWNTLRELLKIPKSWKSQISSRTHVGTEVLYIFSMIGDKDESTRRN